MYAAMTVAVTPVVYIYVYLLRGVNPVAAWWTSISPTAIPAADGSCPANMFACPDMPNGPCFTDTWKCDGMDDCSDSSDESGCTCTEYECRSGLCILDSQKCDNIGDCPDREDEKNCIDKWTCNDSSWIDFRDYCDGNEDCPDGSDEDKCTPRDCNSDEFTCFSRQCIPGSYVCDGNYNCSDGSDEDNCNNTCQSTEFTCNDNFCISKNDQCDGKADCSDAEDEEKCGGAPCQMELKNICDGHLDCSDATDEEFCDCVHGEFHCETTRVCIWSSSVCDGKNDCGDNGDEPAGCSPPQDRCNEAAFVCDDGSCMWNRLVCDDRFDAEVYRCPDGSDAKPEICRNRTTTPVTMSIGIKIRVTPCSMWLSFCCFMLYGHVRK